MTIRNKFKFYKSESPLLERFLRILILQISRTPRVYKIFNPDIFVVIRAEFWQKIGTDFLIVYFVMFVSIYRNKMDSFI